MTAVSAKGDKKKKPDEKEAGLKVGTPKSKPAVVSKAELKKKGKGKQATSSSSSDSDSDSESEMEVESIAKPKAKQPDLKNTPVKIAGKKRTKQEKSSSSSSNSSSDSSSEDEEETLKIPIQPSKKPKLDKDKGGKEKMKTAKPAGKKTPVVKSDSEAKG